MWTPIAVTKIASIAAAGATAHEPGQLDGVMLFGFLAVFFTLVFYINQHRSRSCTIGLAVCLAVTAVYGFLQGAWPLGVIQAVWSASILRQSFKPISNVHAVIRQPRQRVIEVIPNVMDCESRISRMFGTR